jgi:polyisoprenoid-binding protein YceI
LNPERLTGILPESPPYDWSGEPVKPPRLEPWMLLLTLLMACSNEPEPPPVAEPEPTLEAMAPEPIEEPEVVEQEAVPEEALAEAPEDAAENREEPASAPEANTATPEVPKTEPDLDEAVAEAPPEEAEPEAAEPDVAEPEEPEVVATGPVSYALQTGSSSLYVQVFKDTTTAASGMSHDHVMRASGWTGTATWDPAKPENCKIDISVPVDKLVVDPPKLRAAVGYDSTLSDGQRGDVRKNMLSKDQLNSSKYSEISFSATSCKVVSGSKVDVSGKLTIKGTSKPITIRMTLDADAQSYSAKGGFKIKGSDYGLEPFSAMMGALKNQDELRFTVRLSGTAM